jgi:probable non-F420 flavinoid oxidoreductase
MSMLCYHASHEQFAPSHLLKLVVQAEAAGFEGIHSSDHIAPWSVRQGHAGFTFSWIAAALQATSLPFSMICTPGQRLHPAVAAHAIATLGEMFPGRINFELASGEALNEHVTGEAWPEKPIRNKRLKECYDVIAKLLRGDEVSNDGLVKVKEAKIYSLPTETPLLFCAALSEETAKWAGQWADGLITTADSREETEKKLSAFRSNGGEGKPCYVQYSFSYAKTEQEAIDGAYHQWRSNLAENDALSDFTKPEQYDEAAKDITKKDVAEKIPMITKAEQLWENISEFEGLGIDRISLHNVNTAHEYFIEDFGKLLAKKKEAKAYAFA